MSLESYVLWLQKEEHPSGAESVLQGGLSALANVYGRGVRARRTKDMARAIHAGVPVISVGNITAGGTGKTPCIVSLAKWALAQGFCPAIVSRGYKSELEKVGGIVADASGICLSQREAGDEPYMLAQKLPGVPILIGKNRIRSAAAAKAMGANLLLLDDGFQYWKLARDADVVLIDATDPFGGGHLLPRGLLRESPEALARASVILLTKAGQITETEREAVKAKIDEYAPGVPIHEVDHAPATLTPLADWPKTRPLSEKNAETAWLVSAIGNPAAFQKTAEEAGLKVLGETVFPDHHAYTERDVAAAVSEAKNAGAEALVTTEKDAVKIKENLKLAEEEKRFIQVLGIEMTGDWMEKLAIGSEK